MRMTRPLLFCCAVALATVATPASPTPPSAAAQTCPSGYTGYLAGAAKAEITPEVWPVAMAAYSIGRMGTGAADPFYARALAIQTCPDGVVVVLTSLDSQGYFAAYKEDPGPGADGYGLDAIRLTVERDTGVPFGHITIATTHTHNSPDSIGLWGGSTTANNKAPYLSLVKRRTVSAIEQAIASLRPAALRVGKVGISDLVSTSAAVADDPESYPVDDVMRVLHVTDAATGTPISTLVNAAPHATEAGELTVITPDWPGRLAADLDALYPGETSVVFIGGVGRTGPRIPPGSPRCSGEIECVHLYGDLLAERARQGVDAATAVVPGPIAVVDRHLTEEIAEPAILYLMLHEQGNPAFRGVMRSIKPPYLIGPMVTVETQTIRVGDLVFAGIPGEEFPEQQTELAKRIGAQMVFSVALADDQVGYTPPAFEYFVAWCYTGDEGLFTINAHFGDDLINAHLDAARMLGFEADGPYDGVNAGPIFPTVPPRSCV